MKKYKKWVRVTVVVLFSIILFVGLVIVGGATIESYCIDKANLVVGNQWNKQLKPTPDEFKYVGKDGVMFWGVREMLQCESSHNIIIWPVSIGIVAALLFILKKKRVI